MGTKEAVNNFYSVIQPKGPFAARAAQSALPAGQSSAKNLLADKAVANLTAAKAHSTVAAHGHHAHPAPWEGVNLWRTPFKGDTDTITHVKKNLTVLDQYVENRTRRIQQLQILALVSSKNTKKKVSKSVRLAKQKCTDMGYDVTR